MVRCKAPEIPRNEAYFPYTAVTKDEGNAADDPFFSNPLNSQIGFLKMFVLEKFSPFAVQRDMSIL